MWVTLQQLTKSATPADSSDPFEHPGRRVGQLSSASPLAHRPPASHSAKDDMAFEAKMSKGVVAVYSLFIPRQNAPAPSDQKQGIVIR